MESDLIFMSHIELNSCQMWTDNTNAGTREVIFNICKKFFTITNITKILVSIMPRNQVNFEGKCVILWLLT